MTGPTGADSAAALQQALLGRALAAHDPGRLHLRFRAEVLQRYRELAGAQLVRTRSVGRVAVVPGRWSLDVGIVEGDREVHLPVEDLLDRLPETEWPHWMEHLVTSPLSANFLKMRLAGAAACIDDGETAPWDA